MKSDSTSALNTVQRQSLAVAAPALVVGLFLRSYQLLDQVIVGDEWHSFRIVARAGFREIACRFDRNDHCIPISLYLEALSRTLGISELSMRLPFWLASCVLLILVPLLYRRKFGALTYVLFASLLAVAPLLIFYGRFIRAYAFTSLFCLLAVFALDRWWQGGRSVAWAYCLLAAVAAWFNVVILPFVLAPFAVLAIEALWAARPVRKKMLQRLVLTSMLLGVLLAVFLALPLAHNLATLRYKVGHTSMPASVLPGVLKLYWGSRHPAVVVALGLASLWGAWRLFKDDLRHTLMLLSAAVGQVGALFFVSTEGSSSPSVIARYCLPILPILMLCTARGIASGVDRLTDAVRRRRAALAPEGDGSAGSHCWPVWLAGSLVVVLVALSGPSSVLLKAPCNWGNSLLENRLRGLNGERTPSADLVAPFYRLLAAQPPASLTLLEIPFVGTLYANHQPYLQLVHRQRVVMGMTSGISDHAPAYEFPPYFRKLKLRHFAFLDDRRALAERNVDLVVVHKDLSRESQAVAKAVDKLRLASTLPPIGLVLMRCAQDFGPAVYEDGYVAVFQVGAGKSSVLK